MNYVESFDLFGVEAKQIPCIKGYGAPSTTTEGAVGCLYMDIETGLIYKCTDAVDGVYSWSDGCVVRYTSQSLDDEQKTRARKNIGAIGQGESINLYGKRIFNSNGILFDNVGQIIPMDDRGFSFKDGFGSDVILTGIANGIKANDAVNKQQLDAAIASKNAMIVTTISGLTNQTSTEIADHIVKGGVAYLYTDGLYMPISVSASGNYAFTYFVSDEGFIDYYEIDGNELLTVHHKYAQQSQLGDIETALGSIITIQNELLGTISFTINEESYTAIFGMTWKRWCASEYNTIGAYLAEDGFVVSDIGGIYTGYGSDETPQYGDTVIVDGCEYYGM